MRRIQEVIEAFSEGNRISDDEFIELRDRMKQAADVLVGLGPVFRSSFKESNTLYMRAADVCKSRGIGQNPPVEPVSKADAQGV